MSTKKVEWLVKVPVIRYRHVIVEADSREGAKAEAYRFIESTANAVEPALNKLNIFPNPTRSTKTVPLQVLVPKEVKK